MRLPNPWKCDCCGNSKGEGNGWQIGIPLVAPSADAPTYQMHFEIASQSLIGYAIIQWNEVIAGQITIPVHHLCSDKCALTKQAEYLRK